MPEPSASQVQALINEFLLYDTGTSGSIPYLDSNRKLAQNNANLFWDATNARFGLGTTTPDAKLHSNVSSATISAGHFAQSTSTGPVMKLSGTALDNVLTQSLVTGASVTTATKALFVRVEVSDSNEAVTAGSYYLQLFTIA